MEKGANMKRTRVIQKARILTLMVGMLVLGVAVAYALPEGESVAEGSATFDRSVSNTLKIATPSDKVIINYNSFNIGAGEAVYFYQPSASSAALNRVLGQGASSIAGALEANGIIYLINPNGITIAPSASIRAAGLIASTLNIADADFLSGNNVFTEFPDKIGRPVFNNGYIRVREGGQVVLLGSAVANAGTIETSLGSVVLAAGKKITLNLDTAGMISVVIDEPVQEEIYGFGGEKLDSAVRNSGAILNPGGKVILAAKALNHVFDYAINNSGLIRADSLVNHGGVVELIAEGAPVLNTGRVEAGEVRVQLKDANLINKGEVIGKGLDNAPPAGSIYIDIQGGNLLQGGRIVADALIDLKAEGIYQSVDPFALGAGQAAAPDVAVIISAPLVRISAKEFGTTDFPLAMYTSQLYIGRTEGAIDILESLGIGSSIMLRGPPDGFGAILYNHDASLTLYAEQVRILSKAVHFYGDIVFYNLSAVIPDQEIYFEAGKTYIFKGSLSIVGAPDIGSEEFFIKLRSSVEGSYYYLDLSLADYRLERVNVKDAYSLGGAVIPIGVDAGNNVNFEIDPTWDGGGTTNNWSDAVNWSGNTLPISTTDATFDATSTKDSTIDAAFAGTIRDLLINAGYTGTITFARSLSVRDFSQAAGTVNAGSQTLTASRNFSVSGGIFNANSGVLSIAGAFALSGGTFNAGSSGVSIADNFTISGTGTFNEGTSTVTLSGAGATINVLTSETFFNLTFAPTTAGATKTVSANDTLIVTGTLTLTEGNINQGTTPAAGTISAQGDIIQASTFDGGSGVLVIAGTGNQLFTGNATASAGSLPDLTINKSSGTLTLAGTIRTDGQGAGAWTYTAGTIDPGTSTVVFDGGMAITGSHTLKNVTFNNAGTRVIASGTTLTITGTFNYNDGTINTGTISAQGDIIQGSATDGGTAILQITGSANQLFTGNATAGAGELPDLTIDKSGGTLTLAGTIRINGAGAGAWTYVGGTVDAVTNDSLVLFNGANTVDPQGASVTMAFDTIEVTGGTMTLAGNLDVDGNLVISGGTLNTSASNFSVNVAGNWSNSATFTSNSSVVTLDGSSDATMDTGGTAATKDFQTLVINKSGSAKVTLINNDLDIDGTLTIASGVLYLNGHNITTTTSFVNNGTLRLQGQETVSWTVNDTDSGTWEYVGRNISETITLKDFGATDYFNLVINDTNTNKAVFSSGAAKSIAGAFTVSSGTYNANGQATTIAGLTTVSGGTYLASTVTQTFNAGLTISSGTFTGSTGAVDVNGALTLSGGTLTAPTGSFTVSGNWVNNGGTFTAGAGTVTFDGITTVSGSSITTFNTISITGTLTGHAVNMNISGNWAKSGTFNHNSGTVTFVGSGVSVISGSTTFFNLASTTAGKQITFTAGTTQTIAGTLTLAGASGNLLILRSSVSGSQWSINPQGSRSVSFVDVKDSSNTNASEIAATNSKDSGNNTNWNLVDHFIITGSASQTAGTGNSITITAIDGSGSTSTSYGGVKSLTFSGADAIGSFNPTVAGVNFGTVASITFTNGVASGVSMVLYNAAETQPRSISAVAGSIGTGTALSVIVSPAGPSQLVFVQQPSDAAFGAAITPAIQVRVFDRFGNFLSTDNTTPVTLAISANPSGAVISGTLTRNVSGGIASFNDLSVSLPGTGYSLAAASTGLAGAVSDTFSITGTLPVPTAFLSRVLVSDFLAFDLNRVGMFPLVSSPAYFYHPLTGLDIAFFEQLEKRRYAL